MWRTLISYYLVALLVAIVLALSYRWVSTRRMKRVLKQLRSYQAELHRYARKLILIYDNFALPSVNSEESWLKFVDEIGVVAGGLLDLKDKVVGLAVPKLLRPVRDHIIRASNNFSEHIFLIAEATDLNDVINAFGSVQLKNGLDSFKAATEALQKLIDYYEVDMSASG